VALAQYLTNKSYKSAIHTTARFISQHAGVTYATARK